MKAFVIDRYGSPDVLQLRDVEKPTPTENQVLVKVHAASINAADWHLLTADIFLIRLMGGGLFKPAMTILGTDFAGVVEAVGAGVTAFKPGDRVVGEVATRGAGGFAEFVCAPQTVFAPLPHELSFEQGAALAMAGMTALQGLRNLGKVKTGQQVAINGASGGVGTFAVQLAHFFGAEVTAICSARNHERVRTLGADHVIDYTREDFTASGKQYDVIFAANGYHPLRHYARALKPNGVYVMAGGKFSQMIEALSMGALMSRKNGKKFAALSATFNRADLDFLIGLVQAGSIIPVIDRVYAFDQIPDAMRYLGAGHAQGKIVIRGAV